MREGAAKTGGTAPLVSVIMPIYNVEKYLPTSIESVLSQTMKDFELILVEDASRDGCPAICEKYARHPKVRLIRHERNCGLGISRNTGMDAARGKYLYFIDSDDAITPGALELLVGTMEETGAELVHSGVFYHPENPEFTLGQPTKVSCLGEPSKTEGFLSPDVKERVEKEILLQMSVPSVCLNLYRRSLLMDTGLRFTGVPIREDFLFTAACICRVEKIYRIRRPFYLYRQRGGSLTHQSLAGAFARCKMSLPMGVSFLRGSLKGALPEEALEKLVRFYVRHMFELDIYPYFQKFPDLTEEEARDMLKELMGSAGGR